MLTPDAAHDANLAPPAAAAVSGGERALHAEIAHLRRELARSRRLSAEAERLGQTGSWEFVPATGELHWSEGTYGIFGLDPEGGITLERALAFHPADRRPAIAALFAEAEASGAAWDATEPFVSASGAPGWLRFVGFAETREDGLRRVYGFARDVTHAVSAECKLRQLADRDTLTDLYNRRAFLDHLSAAVAASEGSAAWRSRCSTSTTSRTSTTGTATWWATSCCSKWPGGWRSPCGRAIPWHGSAATSSR